LVSSLANKYMGGGPTETLVRACMITILLRFDSYWFPKLSEFIRYLIAEYDPFLCFDLEWRAAKRGFWPERQIDDLYLAAEA